MKKIVLIIGVCGMLIGLLHTKEEKASDILQQLHKEGIERILVSANEHSDARITSVELQQVKAMNGAGTSYQVVLRTPFEGQGIWYYREPDYIRKGTVNKGIGRSQSYDPYERIGIHKLKEAVSDMAGQVIVAVIDSGIDASKSIFQGRLVTGYDFISLDDEPEDGNGHGTSVAAIIAGGTTDQVKIMPLKVLDKDAKGSDYLIAKAIYHAMEQGAKVINLSLAGIGKSKYLDEAMDKALEQGIIIVAGAGNDAINTKHVYPAGKKEIIVVSAVDTEDEISLFANYGESVDISAPGEAIDALSDGYIEEGTSLAAPFISSIASMLAIADPNLDSRLMENYLGIYSDDLGVPLWDKAYGHGIANFHHYFDEGDFRVISRNGVVEPYRSSYIKVYTETGRGTLHIKIDGRKAYEYTMHQKGYYTVTFDVEAPAGEHQVEVYLEEEGRITKVDAYPIEVRDYNLVFEVYNQKGELSTDYTLRLSGGIDNQEIVYLGDDNQRGYFQNGRYYMTLDVATLLQEYDYLLALCEPKDINNDGHKVPVYCKKILTTGKKTFRPRFIQTIYYSEASYANVYMQVNDGLKNQYQWVGMTISKGQQQLLLDQGEHRVFIAAREGNFLYTLQNDYYLILNEENLREVRIDTSNMEVRDMEMLTHVAYMDTKPVPFESYDVYSSLDHIQKVKYNPGRYRLYVSLSKGDMGINLYKNIDLQNRSYEEVVFGNFLTNECVIHYNQQDKQVLIRFLDDLQNRYILYADSLQVGLKNMKTGEFYEGHLSYNDHYQGVERYEMYDFKHHDLPDGMYVLEVLLHEDFIMPTDFKKRLIYVKDNVFRDEKSTPPPKVKDVPHMFSIEPYHTFELNLKEVFQSQEELLYTVDQGYIINDTLYFEGNGRGLFTFHIEAYDFHNHIATYTCKLLVKDDIYFKKLIDDAGKGHLDTSLEDLLYKTYETPNAKENPTDWLDDEEELEETWSPSHSKNQERPEWKKVQKDPERNNIMLWAIILIGGGLTTTATLGYIYYRSNH